MNKPLYVITSLCLTAQALSFAPGDQYSSETSRINPLDYFEPISPNISGNLIGFGSPFDSISSSLSNKEQLISPSNSGLCDRENLFEVKQFEYEGKIICIAPLIFTLSTEDNVYYADNEELDIHACGESISALKESINDELSFIYSFYASKPDEELTYGACELKRKFLDMMKG